MLSVYPDFFFRGGSFFLMVSALPCPRLESNFPMSEFDMSGLLARI
jgi:hypothetical protein